MSDEVCSAQLKCGRSSLDVIRTASIGTSMSRRSRGRPRHLSYMLPPSKWAAVVAIGVIVVLADMRRRAKGGAYGPCLERRPVTFDVHISEISNVITDRWGTIEAQACFAHALHYSNQSAEDLRRHKLDALYLQEQVEVLLRSKGGTNVAAEPVDISGLTRTQRTKDLMRRHRHEIRKQIAAATIQYMSTPPSDQLHRLATRYLRAVHRDLSQLVCPNAEHRHCPAVIAMNAQLEREEIAQLALEAAMRGL